MDKVLLITLLSAVAAKANPLQIQHWTSPSKFVSPYYFPTISKVPTPTGPYVVVNPFTTPYYNRPVYPQYLPILPNSVHKTTPLKDSEDVLKKGGALTLDSTILGSTPFFAPPVVSQFRAQDDKGGYHFSYSGDLSSRVETRNQDGSVQGQYHYQDPAGNSRVYHYVADEQGFRVNDLSVLSDKEGKDQKTGKISSGSRYRSMDNGLSTTTENPFLTTKSTTSTPTTPGSTYDDSTTKTVSSYLMYG